MPSHEEVDGVWHWCCLLVTVCLQLEHVELHHHLDVMPEAADAEDQVASELKRAAASLGAWGMSSSGAEAWGFDVHCAAVLVGGTWMLM